MSDESSATAEMLACREALARVTEDNKTQLLMLISAKRSMENDLATIESLEAERDALAGQLAAVTALLARVRNSLTRVPYADVSMDLRDEIDVALAGADTLRAGGENATSK